MIINYLILDSNIQFKSIYKKKLEIFRWKSYIWYFLRNTNNYYYYLLEKKEIQITTLEKLFRGLQENKKMKEIREKDMKFIEDAKNQNYF